MNLAYLADTGTFLLNIVIGLYVGALMLRFLLPLVQADYYNPISQLIVGLTQPPLRVLRRFIPSIGRIDLSILVLMLVLQFAAGLGVFALQGQPPAVALLLVWTLLKLLETLYAIYFYGVLLRALLSWLGPGGYTPLGSILYSLTEPLLRPLRSVLPPIAGLDLSPLAVMLGLELAMRLVGPLFREAMAILAQG